MKCWICCPKRSRYVFISFAAYTCADLYYQLQKDFFRLRHQHAGASGITLLNYPLPPANHPITEVDIRAGAHKDWGSVTLLFQEEGGQPGLEIFSTEDVGEEGKVELMSQVNLTNGKKTMLLSLLSMVLILQLGTWHPAPNVPNTVLINVGLMMESWTAGVCRATLHRVVFPPPSQLSPKPRRSIAFFGTADPEVVLTPINKGGVVDVEVNNGEPMKVKEFFAERIRLATRSRTEY